MAIQPEQIAREAAAALDVKQAEDIHIYDVRGISNLTDFTVVATGTSEPHLKALISEVQRRTKGVGRCQLPHRARRTAAGWWWTSCMSWCVFSPEARAYYAIEKLWATATEIPLPQS